MRTLVLVTGATAALWVASQSPLAEIWAEAVFSNQVLVDTGHPGSFELATASPTKLAHVREYHWTMSELHAIDDHSRCPEVGYRVFCGMRMDPSPGHLLSKSPLRAGELRRVLV